jgi:hypothetical protein
MCVHLSGEEDHPIAAVLVPERWGDTPVTVSTNRNRLNVFLTL